MKNRLSRLITALSLSVAALGVLAQPAYPVKPVRLIVPFAAGGIADSTARLVGQKLSERLGQPVVVENRGGAGGNIGTKLVAGADADGYTLLATTAAMTVNVNLYRDPGFKLTDFTPIALGASTPSLFAVASSHQMSSLGDFARTYKGRPFTYSSAGSGSSSHLIAHYLFKNLMGLDATHVPYQGGSPAVNAAVSGHVDVVSVSMPTAVQLVAGGRLKGLAVASLKRMDSLPGVQTVVEAGFSNFEDYSWVGFLAPAKTPPAIVRRLNTEINLILRQPDVRERLLAAGFSPRPGTSQDFGSYLVTESNKWARIVKLTGAQPGE